VYGTIAGTVPDASGAAIRGAAVTLTEPDDRDSIYHSFQMKVEK
jgi:hypothetical protein